MSKDTFYLSHDYNARNDIKIKKLITKHGYLGYGLFWAIIEELYNNANALPTDYECIAFDLRTTSDIIESIVKDFDLFVIDKESFGSISVERRLEEWNKKSIKARKSALKRWGKEKKDANALQTQSDSNAIKESKVKENKDNINYTNLLNYFNSITGKNAKVVNKKTRKQIKDRLAEGYTKEDISNAIKNCFNDSYHKETNHKYLTLEFITRPDKLDKFSNIKSLSLGDKIMGKVW